MKKKNKKNNRTRKINNLIAYSFLMPWLIGFLVFTIFPFIYTIFLSFNSVNLNVAGWETTWIGLENYINVLFSHTNFVPALIQFMITEIIYVPVIVIIAFILALLLNQNLKGRAFFRMIYFLPVIVLSGPVMYKLMDSGNTKIEGLEHIFIYKIISSFSPEMAFVLEFLFNNFAIILWFTGIPIVLFLNGLQKINGQLYEAAQIDGATSWQILWKITLPLIKPIALTTSIFTIIQLGIFSVNPVYDLIKNSVSNTVSGLGISATYSWLYSIGVLLLIGITFLLLREKKDKENIIIMRRRDLEVKKVETYE